MSKVSLLREKLTLSGAFAHGHTEHVPSGPLEFLKLGDPELKFENPMKRCRLQSST